MNPRVEEVLKKTTYADKIIEQLGTSAWRPIPTDLKCWIHLNTLEFNIKIIKSQCILKQLNWIEQYPQRSILIVQNNKIFKSIKNIDLKKEALVLIPNTVGEEEKSYISLYLPE